MEDIKLIVNDDLNFLFVSRLLRLICLLLYKMIFIFVGTIMLFKVTMI